VAIELLMFDLSIWRCSPELKDYASKILAKSQVGGQGLGVLGFGCDVEGREPGWGSVHVCMRA
jgi:hypothetical protein